MIIESFQEIFDKYGRLAEKGKIFAFPRGVTGWNYFFFLMGNHNMQSELARQKRRVFPKAREQMIAAIAYVDWYDKMHPLSPDNTDLGEFDRQFRNYENFARRDAKLVASLEKDVRKEGARLNG